jgi:hypothetical protein
MPDNRSQTTLMLWAAFAMPLLYFGVQLMAALFYPGYHFAIDTASMLGTSTSRHPEILPRRGNLWVTGGVRSPTAICHLRSNGVIQLHHTVQFERDIPMARSD